MGKRSGSARDIHQVDDVEADTNAPASDGSHLGVAALDLVPCLLGPMSSIELAWIERPHRALAAFLLAQIDGLTTIETLIDVAMGPRHDVLELLRRWFDAGVLVLKVPSRAPPPSGRRLKSTATLAGIAPRGERSRDQPASVTEHLAGRLILWRGSRWKLR